MNYNYSNIKPWYVGDTTGFASDMLESLVMPNLVSRRVNFLYLSALVKISANWVWVET